MSRSYKHTPIVKSNDRINKRQANKRIRQKLKDLTYEIGNNTYYRHIINSWDICDYKCYNPNDKTICRK